MVPRRRSLADRDSDPRRADRLTFHRFRARATGRRDADVGAEDTRRADCHLPRRGRPGRTHAAIPGNSERVCVCRVVCTGVNAVSRIDPAAVEERLVEPSVRRPGRTVAAGVVLLVVLGVVATRTVPHPVGPARTQEKYVGKAVTTARAAQSEVATVLVVANAATRGNSFGPYTALVVSDSEETLSGVQGTFDSIQPPGESSDSTRDELDVLLSDAVDHVADVRIAARRGTVTDLAEIARPLERDAVLLDAFVEQNS